VKNTVSNLLAIIAFGILAVSCYLSEKPADISYDFRSPKSTIILPDTLHEISGLTCIDSLTLGCVQDENGILFIYDLVNQQIRNQFTFELDGDYEGLARVGSDMYILRSDGTIFEINEFQSPNYKTTTHQTSIPAPNNEGFCYDKANNRLLIGCKGKLGKGKEFKDLRAIYGFDLHEKIIGEKPVFEFDVAEIKAYAERNNLDIPYKEKKNTREPDIKFMISGLCIHPITKELYILSAADHLLFIYGMNGELKHIEVLDKHLFNKAEGLAFLPDGSLYISNEGQDKHPTLLEFKYTKN
jgi:hypothetical protein